MDKKISIIGVPCDCGASMLGARMGPQALRVAGIASSLKRFGCQLKDCGDLTGPQKETRQSSAENLRNYEEVITWNKLVFEAVFAELSTGRIPILLGGDHSIAIGSVSAAAKYCRQQKKKLVVFWFDAHADINNAKTSPSGNIHGMPLATFMGFGPEKLSVLADFSPILKGENIFQIGIRSVDETEKKILRRQNMVVYDMRYIDEIGMRQTMSELLDNLTDDSHLHISYDLDFLDPNIAPGVGTPKRGGPTYREAQLCMEMIADSNKLGSIDLVELNPAKDIQNTTAELAVDLMESLFGKSTLERFHSDL